MKKVFLSVATLISLFFMTNCSNTRSTTAAPVNNETNARISKEEASLNGTWELNYISGPKIAFEGLFPNKKPTLIFNFPKEEASGNGGCNGYSAKVKVEGNKITFGDALSTMMACEGNGEPVYFKTLKTVSSYSISDGKTLNLIMGDIAVLRFSKK